MSGGTSDLQQLIAEATARQREATDPAVSAWVGASAGSGKTRVLTDRVLSLLLAGAAPQEILALTFTKAAAAEMSNRVAAALSGWAIASDEELRASLSNIPGSMLSDPVSAEALENRARQLFALCQAVPGGLKIQTIHAFCQSLLERFPLEAGVPSNFVVLDDREAQNLLFAARDDVLLRAQKQQSGELTAAIELLSRHLDENRFTKLINDLLGKRADTDLSLEASGGVAGWMAALRSELDLQQGLTEAALTTRFLEDFPVDDLKALVQAASASDKPTDRTFVAGASAWLLTAPSEQAQAIDGLTSLFLTQGLEPLKRKPLTKAVLDNTLGAEDQLVLMTDLAHRFIHTRASLRLLDMNRALLTLYQQISVEYRQRKALHARLDFSDLVMQAAALLRQPGGSDWVAYKLDAAISHILVDEAQDTNAVQWQVISYLTSEFFAGEGQERPPAPGGQAPARTLFVVGDRKQSIYSFQGADPDVFDRMRADFEQRAAAGKRPFRNVAMNTSFRSTAAVLGFTDKVFAPAPARVGMGPQHPQTGAVDWLDHVAKRAAEPGSVWRHPTVEGVKAADTAGKLAITVADQIAAWLDPACTDEGAFLTREERGQLIRRRVVAGDFLILLQRRKPLAVPLIRELQKRGVPVGGLDRMVLHEQLVVRDLLALAAFALLPEDDMTLAEVLRGPFLNLTEQNLYDLAADRGKASLWSRLRDRRDEFARAVSWLESVRALTGFRPAFEFFSAVLTELGGRNRLLARLGGEAEDAIDELLQQSLLFEGEEPGSLQRFIHWMRGSETELKREQDSGSGEDGGKVRLMTVHGAKGLQAPVVILPETAPRQVRSSSLLWNRRSQAVPGGVNGQPIAFVWRPNKEAYPSAFGTKLADERKASEEEERRRNLYVALTRAEDRLHLFTGSTERMKESPDSWIGLCDAAMTALEADDAAAVDVREDGTKIFRTGSAAGAAEAGSVAGSAGPAAAPTFLQVSAAEEQHPPRPLSPSRADAGDDEPSAPLMPGGGRFRRGILTHRLLEILPDISAADQQAVAERVATQEGADLPVELRLSAVSETLAILQNPALSGLFGPDSRAEVALSGLVGDRVVAGQVDRLVIGKERIQLIDYKTNRPSPKEETDVPKVYRTQLSLYAQLLRQIFPGREIEAFLLWTDDTRLMPVHV